MQRVSNALPGVLLGARGEDHGFEVIEERRIWALTPRSWSLLLCQSLQRRYSVRNDLRIEPGRQSPVSPVAWFCRSHIMPVLAWQADTKLPRRCVSRTVGDTNAVVVRRYISRLHGFYAASFELTS